MSRQYDLLITPSAPDEAERSVPRELCRFNNDGAAAWSACQLREHEPPRHTFGFASTCVAAGHHGSGIRA
jgi:hypothetical protein